jgi:NAD(P)-dependent dehydrogenase (short-subunit alcohol dehydrogenase family)
MKDKVVLITGSTDGIGKQTACGLAEMGAVVLVHARNADRGKQALASLTRAVPDGKFDLFIADFTSFSAVRKMAADVQKNYHKLDVLINNAATYAEERIVTEDGNEMTFQVNYLSHFLLTHLVMDLLKSADKARIINVSSIVHQSARLGLRNLQGEEYYDGYNAYSCSKLENMLFSMTLAKKMQGESVTVNALHPGVIKTKLLTAAIGNTNRGESVQEGAATSIYLAHSEAVKGVSGKYFVNCNIRTPSPNVFDPNLQSRIWEVSEELVGQQKLKREDYSAS